MTHPSTPGDDADPDTPEPGRTPDDLHTPPTGPPPQTRHGRAGRNLPVAIGVGVGIGAAVVLSLWLWNWGFVLVVALAMLLGSIELHQALRRRGMRSAIIPIAVGAVAIPVFSYMAALQQPQTVPANTILLATLGLTVVAALVWRMPRGQENFARDSAASLFIIAYVPMLGAFASLMLAGSHGVARIVTYLLVVVMGDTGGYVFGVLFGRHPMAPRISPKKSWEGLAGSFVFGIISGVCMALWGLDTGWWIGIVIGVVLVAVGVCGDLVESLIKRDIGIKDMSSFLPGHGGVLDRLDSLLLAAPVAWLIMFLLVPGG